MALDKELTIDCVIKLVLPMLFLAPDIIGIPTIETDQKHGSSCPILAEDSVRNLGRFSPCLNHPSSTLKFSPCKGSPG